MFGEYDSFRVEEDKIITISNGDESLIGIRSKGERHGICRIDGSYHVVSLETLEVKFSVETRPSWQKSLALAQAKMKEVDVEETIQESQQQQEQDEQKDPPAEVIQQLVVEQLLSDLKSNFSRYRAQTVARAIYEKWANDRDEKWLSEQGIPLALVKSGVMRLTLYLIRQLK